MVDSLRRPHLGVQRRRPTALKSDNALDEHWRLANFDSSAAVHLSSCLAEVGEELTRRSYPLTDHGCLDAGFSKVGHSSS
jgi:hypothetical protein